jgi:hypothetical protein
MLIVISDCKLGKYISSIWYYHIDEGPNKVRAVYACVKYKH